MKQATKMNPPQSNPPGPPNPPPARRKPKIEIPAQVADLEDVAVQAEDAGAEVTLVEGYGGAQPQLRVDL